MDKLWCVYVHISPNNKYYVGITSKKPEERWRNGNGYYYNTYFTSAIKKYGWDNFQHEVIASNLTEMEAKNFEKLLIKKLKSKDRKYGYNMTDGGDGVSGVDRSGDKNSFYGKHHTDDAKKKMSDAAKERFEDCSKRLHPTISEARKIQISQEHSKIILQYDLDMSLVAAYDSLLSLEKLGYRRASIRAVCLGKRESYAGCIWRYKNESDAWTSGYIVGTKTDNIYCLDKDFNVVGVYKSYLEANKATGINRRAISKACNCENHFCFGYYWLFKDDCEAFILQSSF